MQHVTQHLETLKIPLFKTPRTSGQAAEIVMREILDDVPANRIIAALNTYRNGLLQELQDGLCSISSDPQTAKVKAPTH
jgi:hypothetical protein